MLRSVKSLEGFAIGATDGTIGKVKDFYFDDQSWVVRYLIVDTSSWLGGKEVLVSPYSINQPDWSGKLLPATISKEQIKNSPSIDSDKPVSRQYEKTYLGYYGYPYYWGGTNLWGENYYPDVGLTTIDREDLDGDLDGEDYDGFTGYLTSASDGNPHLRSCTAVNGYHIRATDGEIGHVDGYLMDDFTWSIRYMIVNTSNWWMGHRVLISPEWIQNVSWSDSVVDVGLTRQSIKDAPVYDDNAPFGRDEEFATYNHYGRKTYWHHKHERAA